ncbi:hypothetical protein WR25_09134 [Diploscapter pachys]|uniref:CCZ1/INTU/HSP4 first Longin domain-containing protein n=1 Tax=Diploscapter pachys TaxID=2018661 RepID=A0A2A2LI13_9BILA|nr:hypothetical protein WR25_09134 [Diploscapter pachys]
MVSIANPLYFFAAPSSSAGTAESPTIRITDVIEFFFVAHPDSGRKEGEEFKRVMYFYPKNEILDRQTDITGFAEAVVNFTENFVTPETNKELTEFPFRTVSTQKAEHVYIQARNRIFVENDQFLIGVALCKQSCQVANYSIFVPALKNVLIDSYKMFRLFFGTMTNFRKHSEEKFRERLEYFFGRYLALLKLHKMPLLDYLGGAEFLPLQGEIYLDIVTMLSEVEEEFPIIKKLVFLYQDKLLYYSISSRDVPSLLRYLTQNLLPGSLASELEPSKKTNPGRFLRGPEDLSLDTPLLGDEALPTVYLNSKDDEDEEEKLQRFQMIVYRCLNATVCMFVKSEVTRKLMRNIDSFLGPELVKVASAIGDSVGSNDAATLRYSCDFHYIYFNPSSLSMTSSFSETQILDDAITGAIKPPNPPSDVNR